MKKTCNMRTSVSVVALLTCVMACAASGQIPIIIEERAGISRANEPVTLGIPLVKGAVFTNTNLRVVDTNGTPTNAQFRTMAFWADGSIKWQKCDFQANVPSNTTVRYALESNAVHTNSTELAVSETGSNITVTTGPLRFIVSKTSFNLFDRLWLDLDGNRAYDSGEEMISSGACTGAIASVSGTNYLARAQAPESISVEEQGDMKAVIKVSGRHYYGTNYFLKYETRIYAYAGQPFVRVRHVYANGNSVASLGDSGDPLLRADPDRYALDTRLNLSGTKTVRFGIESGAEYMVTVPASGEAQLVQSNRTQRTAPFVYVITTNGAPARSGTKAEGWAAVTDNQWGMLVSCRYFWEKLPKGVLMNDNGTCSLQLLPSQGQLWAGMGTGDDILFYFYPANEAAQARTRAMSLSKSPLFPLTSPQQYALSKTFYALLPGRAPYPAMDDYIQTVTSNHLAFHGNNNLYGNVHFGDVPRDPSDASAVIDEISWGNNYYDAVLTSARLLARSSDSRYADVMIPAAWHFMETCAWNTYNSNDWMSGFSPSYSLYHRATGHFEQHYGEGVWYYYYMTGDERAREIGIRAANSIVNQQWWANQNVGCRTGYQRSSAALEAYKNTRNTNYLNIARHLLVNKLFATQDQYGLIGSHQEENNPVVGGEQTFMMALVSDSVWKYLQEAPDASVITQMVRLADFMDQYARKSPGEEEYWNFWNAPTNAGLPAPQDTNNIDGTVYWDGKCLVAGTYAYAYDLTGDTKYKQLSLNLLNNIWANPENAENGIWGKWTCQAMKNMIHAVAIAQGFYQSWVTNYPSLTGTNALGNADPDGDGIANVLEYAWGGNPTNASRATPGGTNMTPTAWASGSGTNQMFYLSWRQPADTNGMDGFGTAGAGYTIREVSFHVQVSEDLMTSTWSSLDQATSHIEEVNAPTTNNDGTVQVTVRLKAPTTSFSKRFMRLVGLQK